MVAGIVNNNLDNSLASDVAVLRFEVNKYFRNSEILLCKILLVNNYREFQFSELYSEFPNLVVKRTYDREFRRIIWSSVSSKCRLFQITANNFFD